MFKQYPAYLQEKAGPPIKKKIKNALWHAGIDARDAKNTRPFDFTEENITPVSAFYQTGGKPFFIRVPLEKCRHLSLMGADCKITSPSPYVRTLVEYSNGTCTTYSGSWLESVHRKFQPQSAADFMGLDFPSCSELKEVPPRGALLPWIKHSPLEKASILHRTIVKENLANGSNLPLEAGDKFFGPTSKEKGELEFSRLITTYESIKKNGYLKNKYGIDNIRGFILSSNNELRFCSDGSNHRFAIMTALGHRYVDLQIQANSYGGIIRREDVDHWPTVCNGYLTRTEALALFDRIYEGELPVSYKRAMQLDSTI